VIQHEGRVIRDGFMEVSRKPGLGFELNKEVVRANLAAGEKYWD
jgi:L-alanine-DL-glutamate epimerase-like enolase superfamily enzyme